MTQSCRAFRTLLERKLVGRPDPGSLSALSWHEHLLGCAACRHIFESEEALEALLATLPDANLSPEIKRRVLVALAKSRAEDVDLDALLERDIESSVPNELAGRVLGRLEGERRLAHASSARTDQLDHLLEQNHVAIPGNLARHTIARLSTAREARLVSTASTDARLDSLLDRAGHVEVPHALGRRVLAGLSHQRSAAPRRALRLVRSAWSYAAAALLVVSLVAWALWRKDESVASPGFVNGADPRSERHTTDARATSAPDAQMLAALDVLENWDLLMADDIDVLLSTIEPADEVLLDYQDEG